MKKLNAVKMAAIMFVLMVGFVSFQAVWVAQLNIPYMLRSLLAISGGMFLGYAASILLLLWIRADSSFE